MKLRGFGPWGVEDVSRATGVSARSLQRWHDNGWANASETIGARNVRRYTLEDVRRVCAIAALTDLGVRASIAAKWAVDIQARFVAAMQPIDRPVVSFGPVGERW